MVGVEGFSLRQIQPCDNTGLLSLGNSAYTPLKTFLRKSAFDFHRYEIAKTYVLINQTLSPLKIWGYMTLMNSEIVLNECQRPQESTATMRYEAFPAVKIARLAVDQSLRGNGFGRKFLAWSINHVQLTIMPYVGCRFLVVDAKRDSVAF